jgi:hypothetical protein
MAVNQDFPNGINVIADIAGQYDTLKTLLGYMPKDAYVLAVGDLIDRGPKSREVVEFFMMLDEENRGTSLLGNHEHMMLDHTLGKEWYESGIWLYNGGNKTLESFEFSIPKEVTDWVSGLSLFKRVEFKDKKIFISHSFWPPGQTLEEALNINRRFVPMRNVEEYSNPRNIIWSRDVPCRRDEYQIAGHNSPFGLRKFADNEGEFALCIDDSRIKRLIGVHIPSFEIYFQEYL